MSLISFFGACRLVNACGAGAIGACVMYIAGLEMNPSADADQIQGCLGMHTKVLMANVFAVFMPGNPANSCFAADEAGDLKLSKALAQVKLFAEFTDEERDLLEQAAALRNAKAGERITEDNKK